MYILRIGGFFGPLIGFPLAGFLVDSRFGWPAIFCVTGGLGVIWTLAWVYWGESSYLNSLSLSEEEKSHIHEAIQHDVKIEVQIQSDRDDTYCGCTFFSHASTVAAFFENAVDSDSHIAPCLGGRVIAFRFQLRILLFAHRGA